MWSHGCEDERIVASCSCMHMNMQPACIIKFNSNLLVESLDNSKKKQTTHW